MTQSTQGALAIVVGGGPAPGINGVIAAVTIEARNNRIEVIGFRDGFKWLTDPSIDWSQSVSPYAKRLHISDVSGIPLRGGSILGTSRANPTNSSERMDQVLRVLAQFNVRQLVTIGGDDTAYSGSQVYEKAGGAIQVAHVPKTIDNDLPLPESTPTFGFETARHFGVLVVRNLAEDARTTSRWYLIVSMGRAAGFLALGIGKASAATCTIIPEEFPVLTPDEKPVREKNKPLRNLNLTQLCDIIIGSIVKRRRQNKQYGVVVMAEGLLEAIGETKLLDAVGGELGRYGRLERDEHDHLRLGEIEFGRMIKDLLTARMKELGLKPQGFVDKDLGYELRCADPIPFDAEYTRDLGYGAVKFLRSAKAREYGAIISYEAGRLKPLPFQQMIDPETKRMRPRKVDIKGEVYEVARRYMIRLEPSDFEEPELGHVSAAAGMSPELFRKHFGYLVGLHG
ncbi:6-phosphofructokinase [Planctomycetaceae bacterium SCGC AG-212-F19]|nr:6-phosphofructokinase [Planctomycetaceae bacterium SCGC AG-212-F19]